jgi:hypothetical protein
MKFNPNAYSINATRRAYDARMKAKASAKRKLMVWQIVVSTIAVVTVMSII